MLLRLSLSNFRLSFTKLFYLIRFVESGVELIFILIPEFINCLNTIGSHCQPTSQFQLFQEDQDLFYSFFPSII